MFIGNETTQRTAGEGDDKCICKGTDDVKRALTADGLCYKKNQHYGRVHCWPRGSSSDDRSQAVKAFCSKEYQGTELCVKTTDEITGGGSNNASQICIRQLPLDFKVNRDNEGNLRDGFTATHTMYYKRVYNRETGLIRCEIHDQCEYRGPEYISKQNSPPVPESWFYPQTP